MVNNPPFNYGEFALVNLNIAIKLGSHVLILPIQKNKGKFIFKIFPPASLGAFRMPLA
jgi:hypothetical protein